MPTRKPSARATDTAAQGKEREKKDTRDECVYPCDDKGERIEQDGAEEACWRPWSGCSLDFDS